MTESESVRAELKESQYLLADEQSRVESLNTNFSKAEIEVQELSKRLHETQQQVSYICVRLLLTNLL